VPFFILGDFPAGQLVSQKAFREEYDHQKTTSRCKAEYQESSKSCATKKNRRPFAKKKTRTAPGKEGAQAARRKRTRSSQS
jgi:hypothetical protein